jgi:hypothetical protein
MPTEPKQFAVFILNADGSGTVRQFETWQDAMTAYAAEDASGKAVYLYTTPAKSVGIGNAPILAPATTPVAFTAVQNTGQYQWPEHPPLPRPQDPPQGPFAPDNGYDAWLTYCVANPDHRECSIPGKPKFGSEVTVCVLNIFNSFPERSTDGTTYPGSRPSIRLADGMGGTFAAEGEERWSSEGLPFRRWYAPCEYPDGFREYQDFRAITFKEIAISSLVGMTVRTIKNPTALLRGKRKLFRYSGNVAIEVLEEQGVLKRGLALNERELEVNALREYVAGEPVFDFGFADAVMGVAVTFPLKPENDDNSEVVDEVTELVNVTVTETGRTHQVGNRSADILKPSFITTPPGEIRNINYDLEAGVGSGFWDVKMTSPTEFQFYFTPTGNTPPDARPPEGWAGVVVRGESPDSDNPLGGEFEGIDTTGVPDGGTYQGPWTYFYFDADVLIDSDEDNDYYTNGTGGYYAEAKEPEPEVSYDYEYNDIVVEESGQEVRTGSRRREILSGGLYGEWEPWVYDPVGTAYEDAVMSNANWRYTSPCGEFVYKNAHKPITANGSGGYTVGEEVDDSPGSGTILQTCEQENLRYLADGEGYYTTEEICTASGEMVDSTNDDVTYNGSGCGTWTIGVDWSSTYTDGNCGTYTDSGRTYNVGDIGSCNGYIYSVDADGNISQRPDCPASGDLISEGEPTDVTHTNNCGTYTIGYTLTNTYADGNCGSYTSGTGGYNAGDFSTCEDLIYSVDSSGVVSTRPVPTCPPNGEWIYGDNCNNYYHDGVCGSYSVGTGNSGCDGDCDSSGTEMGTGSDPVNASTPCGDAQVGYTDYTEYTDGSCGSYKDYAETVYYTYGTLVTSCNDCNYYSNGDGTVYEDCTPPPPPCEPSDLHVEGEDGWTYDGCNWNQELFCFGDPTEPSATDDESPESNGDTDWNTLYNTDGSVYATYDGENWNIV